MNKLKSCVAVSILFLLSSCAAYFNQPLNVTNARLGESTSEYTLLDGAIPEDEPIVVGVYKFRDQTGQYKSVENGSSWSTAVTQGGTSILLKSLEDSKWFTPIERENVSNLLNERQIIRSTRQEYAENDEEILSLPPLLFANILLEGGVVSYDTNIITGGSGARYFGAGGSAEYREDRITIYLRAVATSNGKILKTVYTSKTILSQGISANLFRYVNVKRLLEVETGVTRNEPTQLAVKAAIDKAVETLIIEGIIEGIWKPKGGEAVVKNIKEQYLKEKEEAASTDFLNRKLEDRRGKIGFNYSGGVSIPSMDYANPDEKVSTQGSLKFYMRNPAFNINIGGSYVQLDNINAFSENYMSLDVNLGVDLLPYDKFTPTFHIGAGVISDLDIDNPIMEFQYGIGLEYLLTNKFGIYLVGEQNILFSDDIEGVSQGKYNDYYWRVGLGLSFYFGEPYKKVKSVIFE